MINKGYVHILVIGVHVDYIYVIGVHVDCYWVYMLIIYMSQVYILITRFGTSMERFQNIVTMQDNDNAQKEYKRTWDKQIERVNM